MSTSAVMTADTSTWERGDRHDRHHLVVNLAAREQPAWPEREAPAVPDPRAAKVAVPWPRRGLEAAPHEGVVLPTLSIDFGGTLGTSPLWHGRGERPVDPDAAEALRVLYARGYPLLLSTNTPPGQSRRPALAAAGVLELFDRLIESHELGCSKPHPSFYAAVIEAARRHPAEIIHVGNRLEEDVLAPLRAGMKAVHVQPHRHSRTPLLRGVARIARFADLPALLGASP